MSDINLVIEANIKLFILLAILIFCLYLKWNSKYIDIEQNQYNYLFWMVSKYMTMTYILSFPFFLLLLNTNITFEFFVYILSSIYLLGMVIGLLLLGLFTRIKLFTWVSRDAKMKRMEARKYGKKD